MSDAVITIENLSKCYTIRHQRNSRDGIRHVIERAVRSPFSWLRSRRGAREQGDEIFWALQDVSFEVGRGEAVGVIGQNGAGKSTLLKLLSRITEPTTGRIRLRGRVASLLEVGTGFHPELTGRENIFLNAAILGMRRTEIQRRFDEIVAFSEVERFLDTPVKRYSSGMYVRLAFGVAAHLDPDILLVDEVLAVGDAAFQQKCLGKMGSVLNEGRTILFVSHNMAAIRALCTRVVLIDAGCLAFSGAPQAVIEQYLAKARVDSNVPVLERLDRKGNGRVRFTRIIVLNDRLEPIETVISGQDIAIRLDYHMQGAATLHNAKIQIKFTGIVGQPLFACQSHSANREPLSLAPGGHLVCRIPRLPLRSGSYPFTIWCSVGDTLEDLVRDAGKVSVVDGNYFGTGKLPSRQTGDFLVEHHWSTG